MTFRLYSFPVRCGNTRFRNQMWGDFRPFWRGMLVWRTPKTAKEIPLLEMLQVAGSLPAKFERNRKNCVPLYIHVGLVLSDMHS